MPVGTAQGRLRQRLLFKLVVDAKLNNCFVCEEPIVSLETFSIEHKEPWLDENPDLFWDLDNIAFSHRSCNRPHRKYRGGYTGPKHTCGTQGGYRSGCKCEECRAWKSQDNKRWSRMRGLGQSLFQGLCQRSKPSLTLQDLLQGA